MKRSTQVFLGAMGILAASWGIDRAMRPPQPQLPPCPIGPDGKPVESPACSTGRSSSSSSSGRSYSGFSSHSSSSGHSSAGGLPTGGGVGHTTSSGGWGSFGRAFSGGG